MKTVKSNEIRDKIEELIGQHPALYQLLHYFESELEKDRESRWISVKERLPEAGQKVIAIGDGHTPSVCIYSGLFERYCDTVPGDRIIAIHYDKITHWQPLPEPPKL